MDNLEITKEDFYKFLYKYFNNNCTIGGLDQCKNNSIQEIERAYQYRKTDLTRNEIWFEYIGSFIRDYNQIKNFTNFYISYGPGDDYGISLFMNRNEEYPEFVIGFDLFNNDNYISLTREGKTYWDDPEKINPISDCRIKEIETILKFDSIEDLYNSLIQSLPIVEELSKLAENIIFIKEKERIEIENPIAFSSPEYKRDDNDLRRQILPILGIVQLAYNQHTEFPELFIQALEILDRQCGLLNLYLEKYRDGEDLVLKILKDNKTIIGTTLNVIDNLGEEDEE